MLLKQYGMTAGHFEENHLSQVSRQGQILLAAVSEKIAKLESKKLVATEAERNIQYDNIEVSFVSDVFQALQPAERVLMVPVTPQAVDLTKDEAIQSKFIGFVDRDAIFQQKIINNLSVYDYSQIKELAPDVILLSVHHQHRNSILDAINEQVNLMTKVLVVDQ